MLRLLTIIICLLTQISSELFTTGVAFFASRSENGNTSACALLQKQASDAWKIGGFHSCIANPPIPIGLDWQLISYRIAVDTTVFYMYPEHRNHVEQYAFLNQRLNSLGKQCVTVTGSNWWIGRLIKNRIYKVQMFYTSHLEIITPSVCSTLNTLTQATSAIMILSNCSSKSMEKTGNQRRHEIHLTIHILAQNLLVSEGMHKSIQLITGRINSLSDQCVIVTSVLVIDFDQTVDIHLQFKGGLHATNSCKLLINSKFDVYIISGILTCENGIISHTGLQWNLHTVRLRVQERLNGIPVYLMSKAEIALRVEALFNFENIGCISFHAGHTAKLLKASEHRLISFISGPSSVDICNQVIQMTGANFYNFYKFCVKESTHLVQPNTNPLSSYRLEANEPFYEIDELLYLKRLAELVYTLNKPYMSCESNGYIKLEQRSFSSA